MNISEEMEEEAELSLAPLIDCVFLLLIFFLVSTMMKKEDKDIEVELPLSTSSLEVTPDDSQVVIGIDAEGNFYFEGEPSSANLLHQQLRSISLDNPDQNIRLDTDEQTPFHRVVQVLDICAFRGLNNVGVRTYHERYD